MHSFGFKGHQDNILTLGFVAHHGFNSLMFALQNQLDHCNNGFGILNVRAFAKEHRRTTAENTV